MPAPVFLLGAVAIGCVPAAWLLGGAAWPRRSPVVAIALWQALGLGWGLATIGALVGFGAFGLQARSSLSSVAAVAAEQSARLLTRPGGSATRAWGLLAGAGTISLALGVSLLALLCWILVAAIATALRARHRQRTLLGLLARGDPKVPGALVVDHPAAAAYCVPGLRSAIVVSAGALDLLDTEELAAVLAHERAHLRARHDLVLLPFAALLLAFRWSAVARQANTQVALLVEMLADDQARKGRSPRELATALLRVGASSGGLAPTGALAATPASVSGELAARVTRLLRPPPGLPVPAVITLGVAAAVLVIAPLAALLVPQ